MVYKLFIFDRIFVLFSLTTSVVRAYWSSPIPLGWFIQAQVDSDGGSDWSDLRCNNWYNSDVRAGSDWTKNLSPCPCTVNQSYVDFGSYQQSVDCNFDKPGGCPRNIGATSAPSPATIAPISRGSFC